MKRSGIRGGDTVRGLFEYEKAKGLFLGVLLSFVILACVRPVPVLACSCSMGEPPLRAFSWAGAVFEGRVISTETPGGYTPSTITERILWDIPWVGPRLHSKVRQRHAGLDNTEMQVRVLQSWKGRSEREVTIHTGSGGGDCGQPLLPGSRYLFYAQDWGGKLSISICDRSRPMADAAADLQFLAGQPRIPLEGDTEKTPLLWAIVALITGYFLWLVSRSRRVGREEA